MLLCALQVFSKHVLIVAGLLLFMFGYDTITISILGISLAALVSCVSNICIWSLFVKYWDCNLENGEAKYLSHVIQIMF